LKGICSSSWTIVKNQIPLLLFVRGEGWEWHTAVKSHLGEAEFKQQTFNTEAHSTAPGHLATLILWQIFFVSCLYSCHCHLQYIHASEAFLFNPTTKLKWKQTWMCHTDMQDFIHS